MGVEVWVTPATLATRVGTCHVNIASESFSNLSSGRIKRLSLDMCTFSLVEFGSSEKVQIYLFLQNVRTKMNDISWMIVDMFHYLTLLRM